MSRRRKGHGCGITVLVLLFIFILAGGGLGSAFAKKYMPSNELADKSRVFGIKGGQVALILDNQVQEEKGIYEDGQVYLPVNWVNEHLNERFYWDEGEKLLVYALPESIVYADESTQGEKGPLFKVTQEGMYLSLGVVVNYTDIRTQAFATSQIKRVFIDTSWQPYDTAVLKKDRPDQSEGWCEEPDYHGGSSRRDCGCAGDHGQVVQGQDRGRLHRICGEPEVGGRRAGCACQHL